MNGITKALLIGGGLYLAYRLWVNAGAVQGLSVTVKKIKYGSSDLSKTRFDVELGIINPSGESFSFTRFFGQLRFNGALLATVTKDGAGSGIEIRPADETVISVPVYINHLNTIVSAKEILTQIINKVPVSGLSFNGMLYAGGFSVPVDQTISLPGISGIGRINNCFTCARITGGVLN
jgi:hypothetical protein